MNTGNPFVGAGAPAQDVDMGPGGQSDMPTNAGPFFDAAAFAQQYPGSLVENALLPAGWYQLHLAAFEPKAGAKGTYYEWRFAVLAGRFKGCTVSGRTFPNSANGTARMIGMKFAASLCRALCLPRLESPSDALFKPLEGYVRQVEGRPKEDGSGEKWDAKNEVSGRFEALGCSPLSGDAVARRAAKEAHEAALAKIGLSGLTAAPPAGASQAAPAPVGAVHRAPPAGTPVSGAHTAIQAGSVPDDDIPFSGGSDMETYEARNRRNFTEEEIVEMREAYHLQEIPIQALSWKYRVSPQAVREICYGRTYRDIPMPEGVEPRPRA